MNNPLVSIVITTKNEERHIETCLRSIAAQTYPRDKIEIIVVDNRSTDKTKEIAQKYTNKVFDKGPERSAQRNYGMIEIALGKYVMFVDADMILSPCLLESCVSAMEESLAPPLALHISEVILGTSYWCKVRRFERSFYEGTAIDGARFFLKEAFVQAGGFDEEVSGPEDWDIDKKIKQAGSICLLNNSRASLSSLTEWPLFRFIINKGVIPDKYLAVLYHNESEFNLRHYFSKKNYYIKSLKKYISKWGKDDPDIKKQFGLWYRYAGVFLEHGKWKNLCLHPFLTYGIFMLRFFVGLSFLKSKLFF
ncbi:MAG: glycosyltransferase [Pseudomonadota bacterium]